MGYTILDCYTDEPAGLGVPPYLGTYPRYIAGYLNEEVAYLTIDDLRLWKKHNSIIKETRLSQKTYTTTYNLTINYKNIKKILEETGTLIVILGVHVPGKYLSAIPGTLHEIIPMIRDLRCKKILTGPAVFGTQLHGGKFFEKADLSAFDKVDYSMFRFSYDKVKDYALAGAKIVKQIPDIRMIEIETGHGCDIGHCSFCTEPIKNKVEFREKEDILKEVIEFYSLGCRYFRLGKQTCFYTYPDAIQLLKEIRENISIPLVVDIHFDYRIALEAVKYVDKVRINPGNIGNIDKVQQDLARNEVQVEGFGGEIPIVFYLNQMFLPVNRFHKQVRCI